MKLMMGVQRFALAILQNGINQYPDTVVIVQPGIETPNEVSKYPDKLAKIKIRIRAFNGKHKKNISNYYFRDIIFKYFFNSSGHQTG
jgi:hypothetical protein